MKPRDFILIIFLIFCLAGAIMVVYDIPRDDIIITLNAEIAEKDKLIRELSE